MNANPKTTRTEPDEGQGLTHLFFLLCAILVMAFFAWAYLGRLDVVSTAVGEVIPSTQIKSVQHLEGGIVREIMIKEGGAGKKARPASRSSRSTRPLRR